MSEKIPVALGFDTSNYTTSVSVVGLDGTVYANIKRLLPVKEGERGLRQSDALFFHTSALPDLIEQAGEVLSDKDLVAVGVSSRPRNIEGSYMPCFLAGVSAAHAASGASGVPLYVFSHQCGHIMAALLSAGKEDLLGRPFYAYHVSGGTTDLCLVRPANCGFSCERIGGTADLNAGQLIDRIGVSMGLSFPAGPAMEKLAFENEKKIPKTKISAEGCYIHLSGAENMAGKVYSTTGDKAYTADFVLSFVADHLIHSVRKCFEDYGELPIVFAGGVMSNAQIKKKISDKFSAYFAKPALSADNAVGIGRLASLAYIKNRKG